MFYFSIFVFGKLSTRVQPVTQEELPALIAWAQDNDWSYSVRAV
jgi:hypothetical protein